MRTMRLYIYRASSCKRVANRGRRGEGLIDQLSEHRQQQQGALLLLPNETEIPGRHQANAGSVGRVFVSRGAAPKSAHILTHLTQ